MAGSSLLALIDDIATTLDDVALLTKVAAKKTTGVLGDDLALNAEQVAGVAAERELPVVFAVAKGSAINKIILVPTALLISQIAPLLIVPLLMIGGAYLCFEGFEKVFEKFFHPQPGAHTAEQASAALKQTDPAALEKEKIKGAIRTDFILSAEIVVITLGTVALEPLAKQAVVLASIAVLMTIGVYGLVAAIVKMDDAGFYLAQPGRSTLSAKTGNALLISAPILMKFLGVAGTIAMFLVGGGILTHNIPTLHHLQESLHGLLASGLDLGVGVITGAFVFLGVELFKKFKK